ncbi:MAG: penicillin-insensitive murein endopeptidase [Syntrophobacteraceae bacterium]
MRRYYFCQALRYVCLSLLVSATPLCLYAQSAQALTASFGHPYRGHLENGIPFPAQFSGYQLREQEKTFTTPELIGAVLDGLDAVKKQFPGSCDLYIGDFSLPTGGPINHHRSHQNGRDVDLGMYAKDNRTLDSFIPMNESNLDAAKTWCLIEGILRSQRVQYIFLDGNVQKLLYDHALSRRIDPVYLDHVFGIAGGRVIKHIGGHQDHIHVRVIAPWSTLASKVGEGETLKRAIIEMAQQAYLPKKVFYYANGTEGNLDRLAQSFGVGQNDFFRWNNLHGNQVLTPGSCLVFYKRGFELEPVDLARSLDTNNFAATPALKLASLRTDRTISDFTTRRSSTIIEEKHGAAAVPAPTCYANRGDTLEKIARRTKTDVKTLCELNGIKKNQKLKPGQQIKLAAIRASHKPALHSSHQATAGSVALKSKVASTSKASFQTSKKNRSTSTPSKSAALAVKASRGTKHQPSVLPSKPAKAKPFTSTSAQSKTKDASKTSSKPISYMKESNAGGTAMNTRQSVKKAVN